VNESKLGKDNWGDWVLTEPENRDEEIGSTIFPES
jgi:hypothetical protein